MYLSLTQLPDYRLDILDRTTGRVISTGFFTAKQEEQIGEMIRGINPEILTFKLYGITHEFDDKTSFGFWLADNTHVPMDPGL